jgi:hypothetical protein
VTKMITSHDTHTEGGAEAMGRDGMVWPWCRTPEASGASARMSAESPPAPHACYGAQEALVTHRRVRWPSQSLLVLHQHPPSCDLPKSEVFYGQKHFLSTFWEFCSRQDGVFGRLGLHVCSGAGNGTLCRRRRHGATSANTPFSNRWVCEQGLCDGGVRCWGWSVHCIYCASTS